MNWFKKTVYQVLELEKPAPRLTPEDSQNIASLANHPGFTALLSRLRLQRAVLESTSRAALIADNVPLAREAAVGVNWIAWLDKQVQQQANRIQVQPRVAFELEQREFERMAAALDLIGRTDA